MSLVRAPEAGIQHRDEVMNDDDRDLRRAVALFRYEVIAGLMSLAPRSREMAAELHVRANRAWTIPGTRRTRVAEQTIREKDPPLP